MAIPEPITVVKGMHFADWPSLELGLWNPSFSRTGCSWERDGPKGKWRCKSQKQEERMLGRPKQARPLQSWRASPSACLLRPCQCQETPQDTKALALAAHAALAVRGPLPTGRLAEGLVCRSIAGWLFTGLFRSLTSGLAVGPPLFIHSTNIHSSSTWCQALHSALDI